MGEGDQAPTLRRSTFGSFAVRVKKKRRKRHSGEKPIAPKPKGREDGGSGAPAGRKLDREVRS